MQFLATSEDKLRLTLTSIKVFTGYPNFCASIFIVYFRIIPLSFNILTLLKQDDGLNPTFYLIPDN